MVAWFDDGPDMAAVRDAHGQAHLDYLERHADEIVLAGGLREADDAGFIGGLWVLEVSSRARAVELVERDPYFEYGRRRYRLLLWGQAFPERRVVL